MCNDKELADRIVALGVGNHQHFSDGRDKGDWYGFDCTGDTAEYFVRDWRVAGALMELAKIGGSFGRDGSWWFAGVDDMELSNESLPRAICEACVEALDNV